MITAKHTLTSLIILLLMAVNDLSAQYPCGFDAEMKNSIDNDPAKKIALEKFLNEIQNYNGGDQVLGGGITYIIPIVVHVIHDNGISNISDAQVKDAIRILNEDFQKRNADTSLVVIPFNLNIGNVGVEFRLAAIDPDGNCTNGITHTFSLFTNAGNGPAAKSLICWDTQKYYNIWVVNYLENNGGAVGGYSFLPGTAPANEKEGSIMLNQQFGSIGTSYNIAAARATVTHETGHFLGLYHTFGAHSTAGSSSACSDDDGVSDTPPTIGSVNDECNTSQKSCGPLVDNVQNYMDYSGCPYMFTNGQKNRMIAALNSSAGYRSNLWSANNLIATGVNDGYVIHECAPKAAFYSSQRLFCTSDSVTFYDISYNDSLSTNRTFKWTFEGGISQDTNSKNPVVRYNNPGKYKVKLEVSNSFGSDSVEIEDYIEVYDNSANTYVYFSEGFDDSTFPINSDSSKSWHISSPGNISFVRTTAAYSKGSASLSVDLHTESGCEHTLISPDFDLSAVSSPINFSFDFAYAQENVNSADLLKVYLSEDCGLNWLIKATENTNALKTKEPLTTDFIPTSSEWNNLVVNMNIGAGKPNCRIKIVVEAARGNKLYLDNVLFFHGNVGVSEINENNFSAKVFPNPIVENSVLSIESENIENISVELYDVIGRKISALKPIKTNTTVLNELFPAQEKGIYFLKIINGVEIKTISILF